MLGIGFIITHFVAMQKPQQRKYHSSCNRSVHRGTAHGKQEVKVCKRKTPHLFLMRSFLSPYGDGTIWNEFFRDENVFSPPYGEAGAQRLRGFCRDKLKSALQGLDRQQMTFPSPRGENPLSHGLRRASSPERGSFCSCRYPVLSSPFGRAGAQRLRGFYGDKLKSAGILQNHQRGLVFVPLRG